MREQITLQVLHERIDELESALAEEKKTVCDMAEEIQVLMNQRDALRLENARLDGLASHFQTESINLILLCGDLTRALEGAILWLDNCPGQSFDTLPFKAVIKAVITKAQSLLSGEAK